MKSDAVRMLEVLEGINVIFAKHTDGRSIFGEDKGDGRYCFNCVFGTTGMGSGRGEDHPFWAELWAYLEPHVDVQAVKDTYPNIGNGQLCKGRKVSDLLRTIAEHMLPAAVLAER